jgi:DNA-binding CsgD family transcriptional regulator
MSSFPWPLIEAMLVGAGPAPAPFPCVFRDASMLGLVAESEPISDAEYRRATDQRTLHPVRSFQSGGVAVAVCVLAGRHVGTLGSVIPTGRAFSTLAHVVVPATGARGAPIVVESALLGQLTASGVELSPTPGVHPGRVVWRLAAERRDLLEGHVSASYWARAWQLSPRLARLAVLLMAGISPRSIGERLGLSIRTVRTYTEELLARAGLHSRNELGPAALRDGAAPPACDA